MLLKVQRVQSANLYEPKLQCTYCSKTLALSSDSLKCEEQMVIDCCEAVDSFNQIGHKYSTDWIYTAYIYNSPFTKSRSLWLLSPRMTRFYFHFVHSSSFWGTISPRKFDLICGVKVCKCQLLIARCHQNQALFCATVTSSCTRKWFNLWSRWRMWQACCPADLFWMFQDHQSRICTLNATMNCTFDAFLHVSSTLTQCFREEGSSLQSNLLDIFWKEIWLFPVKKHCNSTRMSFSHRGLNKQGYKCRRECFIDPPLCLLLSVCWNSSGWNILFVYPECNAAIHKRCIEKIIGKCTGSAANSRDTMVSKVNVLALVARGVFNLLFRRVGSQRPAVFDWLIVSKWHLVEAEKKSTQW